MRKVVLVSMMALVIGPGPSRGQVGGNVGYAQAGGKAKAEQAERGKRVLTRHELPPTGTGTFVEASVLMNVKADDYVAVFGISHEGETPADCARKMDATVRELIAALGPLGVEGDDLFVDFVAQNKVYGFEVAGDVAREKLVGFELKKNLSIHYRDRDALDRFVAAAAQSQVYDLIKVDYIVKDARRIRDRLMEEATRVVKEKMGRYEKLLDIKLQPPAQVYAERYATYEPTGMYDSYTAQESEQIDAAVYRQKYAIHGARKNKTFFYNGLDADGFDEVINPVVVEPVVQYTLYLKLKYEVEPVKAR